MANENKNMEHTISNNKTTNIHPGIAAAVGVVVGAAGGVAATVLYQNPEFKRKAKKQFEILSKKATKAWDQVNTIEQENEKDEENEA